MGAARAVGGEVALPRSTVLSLRHRVALVGGVLLVTALAWVVTVGATGTMQAGVLEFVVLWTVMLAAMMLPSELAAVLAFAAVAPSRERFGFRPAPAAVFVVGYFALWSTTGIGVAAGREVAAPLSGAWGTVAVGGALVVAGGYQLTPWKALCLGHCRTPMHFFMDHWHDGIAGGVRMGAHHGAYCIACCWGLMLAMVALGMLNLVWTVVVAVVIFAEKVAPAGGRIARFAGVGLVVAGILIALGILPTPGGM